MTDLTRRALLCGGCALALAGCGGAEEPTSHEPLGCDGVPGTAAEGWVEVPLADHPALAEVGGSADVQVPSALLDVVVVRTAEDCWVSVWRNCSHGACHVEYARNADRMECPCHGSRFGLDGRVLRGPATRPLATFRTARAGGSLWIHRPR